VKNSDLILLAHLLLFLVIMQHWNIFFLRRILRLDWYNGFYYFKNSISQSRTRKAPKNIVADHLLRLTIDSTSNITQINDYFPDESLLSISTRSWFGNIVNFLATGDLPTHWSTQDKRKFLNKVKNFYWDDPYLFKYYPNQIFQRCISKNEVSSVIKFYHSKANEGHFSSKKTTIKILQCGFYWPTMFKDMHSFCKTYENCQKLGYISKRHIMPLNPICYWNLWLLRYRFYMFISSIIWFCVHISRSRLCFKMDRGNSKSKQWS